jgi:hypothetical protein
MAATAEPVPSIGPDGVVRACSPASVARAGDRSLSCQATTASLVRRLLDRQGIPLRELLRALPATETPPAAKPPRGRLPKRTPPEGGLTHV